MEKYFATPISSPFTRYCLQKPSRTFDTESGVFLSVMHLSNRDFFVTSTSHICLLSINILKIVQLLADSHGWPHSAVF